MSKVAVFFANDTGGSGVCNTPPTSMSPSQPGRRVYVNGVVVMASGDVLTNAAGLTPKGDPCVSSRVVQASRRVYVNGKSIAAAGDTLNIGTGILTTVGISRVYVV